jgi:signal transduction histidine kinase
MRFGGPSLRWRLSWLLATTAVLTVSAFGIVAYRSARNASVDAADVRLRVGLTQLRTLTEQGAENLLDALQKAAHDPVLVEAVRHPAAPGTAVGDVMKKLRGNNTAAGSAVEVVDARGRLVARLPEGSTLADPPPTFAQRAEIGPLFEQEGGQFFYATVPVLDEGVRIGGIRLTRPLQINSQSQRIIETILGEDSSFMIGNRDGRIWSSGGEQQFPLEPGLAGEYNRGGRRMVGLAMNVEHTPWMFVVDVPLATAIGPARALILPFAITGSLIAIAGALVGFRASGRIARPLSELTAAAEAIARGERTVPLVATGRGDEVGRLARAFASMSTSVHLVRDQLEAEVGARSEELSAAVERLRKVDRELKANERFAAVGRVSGRIGHELRNPLGVMSTVVLLIDSLPDASPKLREYAALLREQIALSDRIISDVLDQARATTLQRVPVDLRAFLDGLVDRSAVPPGVETRVRMPAHVPTLVFDKDRVGQIVWNLISNAAQAMDGRGTVTVSAQLADSRLAIDVCDTGPGVSAADAERIFDPLYTTKSNGVGLGLSVSRAAARAHGGDLSVRNPGERGACIRLEIAVEYTDAVAATSSTAS